MLKQSLQNLLLVAAVFATVGLLLQIPALDAAGQTFMTWLLDTPSVLIGSLIVAVAALITVRDRKPC